MGRSGSIGRPAGVHASAPWGRGAWAGRCWWSGPGGLLSGFWKQPGWEAWPPGAARRRPPLSPDLRGSPSRWVDAWLMGHSPDLWRGCSRAGPPVWGQRPRLSGPLAPPGATSCGRGSRVDCGVPGPLGGLPGLVWSGSHPGQLPWLQLWELDWPGAGGLRALHGPVPTAQCPLPNPTALASGGTARPRRTRLGGTPWPRCARSPLTPRDGAARRSVSGWSLPGAGPAPGLLLPKGPVLGAPAPFTPPPHGLGAGPPPTSPPGTPPPAPHAWPF